MTVDQMSTVERQVVVNAPRSRVWRALTTASEFGKWFGVKTGGEFTPGARVQMTSTHPGSEGVFYVEIDTIQPESRFSWRWSVSEFPQPASEEPATLVVFELEEVGGGTLVKVTESGFERISLARRAKAYKDNEGGWDQQMQNIRKYVEETA
jgi:uncharacterized protein YndB with AHSA1/START domain